MEAEDWTDEGTGLDGSLRCSLLFIVRLFILLIMLMVIPLTELRTVREPNSDQVVVTAPAAQVRRLVLDPTRMAELGEEVEGITWLGEADAPALGARFLGRNRNGRRRWETECTVTECTPDRIGYDVHARAGKARVPISHWRYDVVQVDAATSRGTETNWIKAPLWFAPLGSLIIGAAWRPAANRAHIATTLERVRAAFEQPDWVH